MSFLGKHVMLIPRHVMLMGLLENLSTLHLIPGPHLGFTLFLRAHLGEIIKFSCGQVTWSTIPLKDFHLFKIVGINFFF